MNNIVQNVRGMHDISGKSVALFNKIIHTAADIFTLHGFEHLITPIVEMSALFERNLGDDTDVVSKEIYKFLDRGNKELALRPEFTASIGRFAIENAIHLSTMPKKYFSYGPIFRYDRPQSGRYRQFNQVNCEIFGTTGIMGNVDCIKTAQHFLESIGIKEYKIEINFLGNKDMIAGYAIILKNYFDKHKNSLSETNQKRIASNPLRILDDKENRDIIDLAPPIDEYYSEIYKQEIMDTIAMLNDLGIHTTHNTSLVRGLDYYNDLVFEFIKPINNNKTTILGGGRYDGLLKQMSGGTIDLPATGFAAGVERLMLCLEEEYRPSNIKMCGIIPVSEHDFVPSYHLETMLHNFKIPAIIIFGSGSVSKRLTRASKLNCSHTIIYGEDDIPALTVKIKNLSTGEENIVNKTDLAKYFIG